MQKDIFVRLGGTLRNMNLEPRTTVAAAELWVFSLSAVSHTAPAMLSLQYIAATLKDCLMAVSDEASQIQGGKYYHKVLPRQAWIIKPAKWASEALSYLGALYPESSFHTLNIT